MYKMMYFENKEDYKIVGEYCIHRYEEDDLFDCIESETGEVIPMPTGCITKYNCNYIVAWLYSDHIEKVDYSIGNYTHDIHFGSRLYAKLDKAANNDKRALKFLNNLYMRDVSQCDYILIYNNNDLLK